MIDPISPDGPRIYSTAPDGTGFRREADHVTVADVVAAGRKVFTTKGTS